MDESVQFRLVKLVFSICAHGVCLLVEGRGSRVNGRGSRVNGRGSKMYSKLFSNYLLTVYSSFRCLFLPHLGHIFVCQRLLHSRGFSGVLSIKATRPDNVATMDRFHVTSSFSKIQN